MDLKLKPCARMSPVQGLRFTRPLLIDINNNIIACHGRTAATKPLGIRQVSARRKLISAPWIFIKAALEFFGGPSLSSSRDQLHSGLALFRVFLFCRIARLVCDRQVF
jgi:hypothetical protein